MYILYFIIGIIFVFTIGAFFAYRIAFYNSKKIKPMAALGSNQYAKHRETTRALMDEMKELEFEEVSIVSFDGLKLFGKYYHLKDGAPLQIQCHGYRGNAYRDFCGGNKLARESGFNTLVIDERAHGKSDGHSITLGINERKDVRAWIDFAITRFGNDVQIVLVGISMGAATVVMTSDLSLPRNVVGIIADSPYSSPKEAILKLSKDMGFPPGITYPFVYLGALLFGGFKINDADASEAVKKANVPILVIHGEQDRLIPCEMSDAIKNSAPTLVIKETFSTAGHGLSCLEEPERYRKLLNDFYAICKIKGF